METSIKEHEYWMQICIELGKQAMQDGNPPVGSILVKDKQIIGEGREAGKSKSDITCHAEIEAIRDAVRKGNTHFLSEALLYTTHEPCIMCSYVIRHHKIPVVVMGTEVPLIGGCSSEYPILTTDTISIWSAPPQIITGVLKEECDLSTGDFRKNFK
ncbi:nucleoside deaminase [Rhodocytophaga rosea]|uniref:Nucleoside deaminase n=2 Tax=Rhodocytophaga rosea TaxID=2704465 RepID=A0A6C0GVH1_9BACT|nr:nucleoside deaminase [Rhodocytophaga rosea]